MIFDPKNLERSAIASLINGLVSPRPIAWVSTLGEDGRANLAPFSFFNAFSYSPPTIAIGPGSRNGVNKDTLRNISQTGEFTISMVNEELAELANATSAEFPPEINEWEALGIEGAASAEVKPRRVAASPAAFECKMLQILELGSVEARTNSLIVGRIVKMYVRDDALDGMKPLRDVLRLVGRMDGDEWCRTANNEFILERPKSKDAAEVRKWFEKKQI